MASRLCLVLPMLLLPRQHLQPKQQQSRQVRRQGKPRLRIQEAPMGRHVRPRSVEQAVHHLLQKSLGQDMSVLGIAPRELHRGKKLRGIRFGSRREVYGSGLRDQSHHLVKVLHLNRRPWTREACMLRAAKVLARASAYKSVLTAGQQWRGALRGQACLSTCGGPPIALLGKSMDKEIAAGTKRSIELTR